jgi:hypothetical protein
MANEIIQQKEGSADNVYEQVANGVEGDICVIQADGSKLWVTPQTINTTGVGAEDEVYSTDDGGDNVFRAIPVNYWLPFWDDDSVKTGTLALDSGWTMLSNKATAGRPAPQASGPPEYGFDGLEVYTEESNISVVYSGQSYTFLKDGWIETIHVRVPEVGANISYRFIVINVTTNTVTIIEEPVLVAGNWSPVGIGSQIVRVGEQWLVYISAVNSSATTVVTGDWSRATNSNGDAPATGSWVTRNNFNTVKINKIDDVAADRSAELLAVLPDTTLYFEQFDDPTKFMSFRTTGAAVDQGAFVEYETVHLTTGSGGEAGEAILSNASFTIPIPEATKYYSVTNHWVGDPASFANITGFLQYDGVSVGGNDDNGFGIDLRFQDAYISPDWDLVSHSGAVGGTVSRAQTVFESFAVRIATGQSVLITPSQDDVALVFDQASGSFKLSSVRDLSSLIYTDATLSGLGTDISPLTVNDPFDISSQALLGSAIQPLDNVSALVNDAGYITSGAQAGDNVSIFVNDAGYLTAAVQSGDNVSVLVNDAGYLTAVPVQPYGEIYASSNLTQSIGNAGEVLAFNANGAQSGTTADQANNRIDIPTAGDYNIEFSFSVDCEKQVEFEIYIRVNGSNVRQIGTIGVKDDPDFFVGAGLGAILGLSINDQVQIWIDPDANNKDFDIMAGSRLTVTKVN